MEPRGELCIKSCASAPFCTSGWFGDAEARCSTQSEDVAAGAEASLDSLAVSYAHSRLERRNGFAHKQFWKRNAGSNTANVAHPNTANYVSDGPKLIVNVEDFSTNPKFMLTRGNESCFGGLDDERECVPLEQRYEPLAFRHLRRNQSNLYYRFQAIELGDKHCCCR